MQAWWRCCTTGQPGAWRGGLERPDLPGLRGPVVDLMRRLSPAVDVVFTAHTHQATAARSTAGRWCRRSYGRGVSVVDVMLDPATGDVDRGDRSRNLPVLHEGTPAVLREGPSRRAEPAPFLARRFGRQ